MMMFDRSKWIVIALVAFAALAAVRSVVVVDATEAVYVTEFGRPVRLIRKPGLHFKWPHQSRHGFDVRLRIDAPPPREMLTKDKKNLDVAWYVAWRIEDVDRFLRTVRTAADASARVEDMIASVLAAELAQHELTELVRVGEDRAIDGLMDEVSSRVAEDARRELGLAVADVRLRRLNYPDDVRGAIFDQIRSERQRVAAATRAEGESQARLIRSAADRQRAAVVAEAEADAARTMGEGEAEATRIANEAHAADPDFYRFLKTLETYRAALDRKTMLVLSADSPFLQLLTRGVPHRPAASPPSGSPDVAGAMMPPAAAPASGGP